MTLRRVGFAGAALSCALFLAPLGWSQTSTTTTTRETTTTSTDYDSPQWTAPRGYDMAYPENGRPNMVARQGYAAGFNEGVTDASSGKRFSPTDNKAYGKAVIPKDMDHEQFKQEYREAFVKGYTNGYRGDHGDSDRH